MRNRSISSLPAVLADYKTRVTNQAGGSREAYKLWIYDVTYLHFHRNLELGYCISGEGICYVEGEEYPFSPGDVQIIFPYQRHLSKSTTETPSTWYWANIDPVEILQDAGFSELDRISGWITNEMGICGIVDPGLYPDICDSIRKVMEDIFDNNRKSLHKKEELGADLLTLLVRLCNRSADLEKLKIKQESHLVHLAPALELIKESLENETMPTVARMSQVCHMSVANFRKVFHKTLGVSPKEHITACVMHKAKRELACTEKSIIDIAVSVGYRNISGFNRGFLEFTGMTPSEFRSSVKAP